jgi:hypothetical protein
MSSILPELRCDCEVANALFSLIHKEKPRIPEPREVDIQQAGEGRNSMEQVS